MYMGLLHVLQWHYRVDVHWHCALHPTSSTLPHPMPVNACHYVSALHSQFTTHRCHVCVGRMLEGKVPQMGDQLQVPWQRKLWCCTVVDVHRRGASFFLQVDWHGYPAWKRKAVLWHDGVRWPLPEGATCVGSKAFCPAHHLTQHWPYCDGSPRCMCTDCCKAKHADACYVCKDHGKVMCCDGLQCATVAHYKCVGLLEVPAGKWLCEFCAPPPDQPAWHLDAKPTVLSLFDGIAVGRQALKQLGFREGMLGGYHAFEVNKDAIAVAKSNHVDITHHGDVRAIDFTLLAAIIKQNGPIRLIMGGPPCPNLALVNADRRGVLGDGSNLLHYFYIILHHLQMLQPGEPVHFLMENVQGMGRHNREYITALFSMHTPSVANPVAFNSNLLGPSSRPRLYWTNVPGAHSHMAKIKHAHGRQVPALANYLDAGRCTHQQAGGCLLRTGQKDRPVNTATGEAVTLSASEAERIMVVEGYTARCNLTAACRLELLGDSWHLQTIVELFSNLMRPS